MRSLATMGFLGCATIAFTLAGCGGIETVPYRQQPTAKHPAMARISAERFSGCVKDYVDQLDGRYIHIDGKVQVDPKGRIVKVVVDGVPRSAPDFAGCVNVTLHEMAVPEWMLQLRPDKPSASTNEKTTPAGNALANPIVVFEVLVVLAELVIEREGVKVVFTVALDMIVAAAAETQVAVETAKQEKNKDKCTDYYEECVASVLFRRRGNHWNQTRCGNCARVCVKNDGEWPFDVGGETCEY
jgi:hypothetical protein